MAENELGDLHELDRCRTAAATAGRSSPDGSWAARDPRLVLVVDDNKDCADSLQMLLSSLGYKVQVAYEGYTAMRMFNAAPFGIVLLDLSMPGMHGLELARRLRTSSSPCPLIIAISGWADARTKEQAREAGVDRYVVKPAEVGELEQLLAGVELSNAESVR